MKLRDLEGAQEILGGVSAQTVYRAVKAGELAVVKIGARTLFRDEDLEAFVDRHLRLQGGTGEASTAEDDAVARTALVGESRR